VILLQCHSRKTTARIAPVEVLRLLQRNPSGSTVREVIDCVRRDVCRLARRSCYIYEIWGLWGDACPDCGLWGCDAVQFGTYVLNFTRIQLHWSVWVSQKVSGKICLNFAVLAVLLIVRTETSGPEVDTKVLWIYGWSCGEITVYRLSIVLFSNNIFRILSNALT
jgi:hypothetical protein